MNALQANEILYQIFLQLKQDQATLVQLTLTSKQCRLIALPLLYDAPQWSRLSQIELFAQSLNDTTGQLVHRIDLHMVSHRWKSHSLFRQLCQITQKTPHLEWLNLDYCTFITNTILSDLTAPLPDLRILSVASCPHIGDHGIQALITHCPYLQEIYLGSTLVSDDSLALLAQMKLLEHISLRNCQRVTETGMNALTKLKTLKSLDIKDCFNVVWASPLPSEDDLWMDEEDE